MIYMWKTRAIGGAQSIYIVQGLKIVQKQLMQKIIVMIYQFCSTISHKHKVKNYALRTNRRILH